MTFTVATERTQKDRKKIRMTDDDASEEDRVWGETENTSAPDRWKKKDGQDLCVVTN